MQGHADAPLNTLGKKQAQLLGELLEVVNFDIVYSSDLKRARQTTAAIMKYQQCKVQYIKKLREAHYGIFDRKPYKLIDAYFREMEKKFPGKERYEMKPPKGESGFEVQKRIVQFVESLYRKHPNETVLISTHGRVKRMLIGHLTHVPMKSMQTVQRFHNCSLTVVEFDRKNGHRITLQNHIKHLSVLNGSSYVFEKKKRST